MGYLLDGPLLGALTKPDELGTDCASSSWHQKSALTKTSPSSMSGSVLGFIFSSKPDCLPPCPPPENSHGFMLASGFACVKSTAELHANHWGDAPKEGFPVKPPLEDLEPKTLVLPM